MSMNNKNKANIILVTVFILFVAARIIKHTFSTSMTADYISFIFEAALVGGIADWFAVTALFREPLGFSWHTAIIPRNREKIVEKVAELVERELIGVDTLTERLAAVNPTDVLLDKISGILTEELLQEKLSGFLSDKAAKLDAEEVSRSIEKLIKDNLLKEGMAVEIRNSLIGSVIHGKHVSWLSNLVRAAGKAVKKPATRQRIYEILVKQEKNSDKPQGDTSSFILKTVLNISNNSEHTNPWAISGILQTELADMLARLESDSDPVSAKFSNEFAAFIESLDDDGNSLTQAVQTWKNGVVEQLDLAENLQVLINAVVQSQLERSEVASLIADQVIHYKTALEENKDLRNMADEVIRSMMKKIIANEHHLIGDVARETLGAFTNERLNKFVEDTAGEELQWIRINGSIVGAVAGAIIFPFANLFYQPYVVPLIRQILGIH